MRRIGDVLTLAENEGIQQVAPLLFYLFAALAAGSAWAIVFSQNIVRMAAYLLATLIGVAGLYLTLSAELIAALQLIVYAGGTLVLIVFGVMLTSRTPRLTLKPHAFEVFLAFCIAIMIAVSLWYLTESTALPPHAFPASGDHGQIHAVGVGILTKYLVPFELAAVLLLVVMVGAAFLARKRAPLTPDQLEAHDPAEDRLGLAVDQVESASADSAATQAEGVA